MNFKTEEIMLANILNQYYESRKAREELEYSIQRQKEMLDELEKSDYQQLINILIDDVVNSIQKFNEQDNQFNRRSVVRNIYAFVEGVIYTLKQDILVKLKYSYAINLEPEEILILREQTPQLEKSGKAKAVTKYVDLLSNIRASFYYYAKAFNIVYKLDISENHWTIFQKSLKVRHRITHPKAESDMDISNQELAEVYISYAWFKSCVTDMLNIRAETIKNRHSVDTPTNQNDFT
ncbi:MAG: hypothetical protein V9G63_04095 [Candidatus Competibacter sp.]|nr:hypothetical protein [Candidatus Competibacteraceae bacterium]